jgi:hypothetical protein
MSAKTDAADQVVALIGAMGLLSVYGRLEPSEVNQLNEAVDAYERAPESDDPVPTRTETASDQAGSTGTRNQPNRTQEEK